MNNENRYLKAIKLLKSNKPVLANRERLTDDIMRRVKESSEKFSLQEKLVNSLFGWVNIYWLRGTMAVAAALIIGFFIIQQVIIADRLNSLEKQLVRTVNLINGHEPDHGIMQKVLLKMVKTDEDSITVSKSDLEDLLNSYLELQKNNENTKQGFGLDFYRQNRIKRNFEKSTSDNEM